MSFENQIITHHAKISFARGTIQQSRHKDKLADIDTLDAATEKYIRAKTHWTTLDNDDHMIELIGSWSRINRILMQMDAKYGIWK